MNYGQEGATREVTIRRPDEDVLVSLEAGEIVAVLDEFGWEATLTELETRAAMDAPHGTILTPVGGRAAE